VHVLISLAGIGSGFVVLFGLLSGKLLANWNSIFLLTTILTSVTGFFFPLMHLLPSHKLGIISLVVLAMAVAALYGFKLAGKWRTTYVVTAVLALYLNCFVAVVQSFLKIPALHAMAHTQTESPFLVAQTIVLLVLVGLGIVAAKRFRPASPAFTVHSRAA
jgi:hypothetical protein